jgi:hypothetical protein
MSRPARAARVTALSSGVVVLEPAVIGPRRGAADGRRGEGESHRDGDADL